MEDCVFDTQGRNLASPPPSAVLNLLQHLLFLQFSILDCRCPRPSSSRDCFGYHVSDGIGSDLFRCR
ncbi:hypothetical protein CK203_024135 [Vitis vinifera]|uniref:Uncharacterized protein n=1 Tax=Vitis vinifera TaxID=29760 RepID=A0A438I4L2_VITVI|nr:hypothetical protein CK203_024135 [Vitis vinifera]